MKVLNVGGGPSRIIPDRYDGWVQHLLDIDPAVNPNICMDALDLIKEDILGATILEKTYDAVYCSHNLEHFYKHEVPIVLAGFKRILNEDGFAEISVPNIKYLISQLAANSLDIDDVWYRIGGGAPITFHDVLYGWNIPMSQGNEYYAHKCGFTPLSLNTVLVNAGFGSVFVIDQGSNLLAYAYKKVGMTCP